VLHMDKNLLFKLINEDDLSLRQISKTTNLSLSTVRYWCKKYGLKSQHQIYSSKNWNCNLCGETNKINFYGHKKSLCKKCMNEHSVERILCQRKKIKIKLYEAFGKQCSCCGLIDHYSVYDFHHLNSKEKEFSIADKNHGSWGSIKDEAKKCTMVCSNCHRKLHSNRLTIINPIKFDENKIKSFK